MTQQQKEWKEFLERRRRSNQYFTLWVILTILLYILAISFINQCVWISAVECFVYGIITGYWSRKKKIFKTFYIKDEVKQEFHLGSKYIPIVLAKRIENAEFKFFAKCFGKGIMICAKRVKTEKEMRIEKETYIPTHNWRQFAETFTILDEQIEEICKINPVPEWLEKFLN